MQKQNKIICLVGESGSGKTKMYDLLREAGYKVVDSYTTRPPRKVGELGHTFVTPEEFDAIRGDLAAYTKFDGYEYGTTHEQLESCQFYAIDPAGVAYFADKIGRENIIVVYLACSEITRYERMERDRGESHAYWRIKNDRTEFNDFVVNEKWDHLIHNEFPEQLLPNVLQLVRIANTGV